MVIAFTNKAQAKKYIGAQIIFQCITTLLPVDNYDN
jgi:hypothetical protein